MFCLIFGCTRTCFHFYSYFLFYVAELYDFPSKSEFSNRTLLLCVLCVVKHSAALQFIIFSFVVCIIVSSVLIIRFFLFFSRFRFIFFGFSCLFTFSETMSNCSITQNSGRCLSPFNAALYLLCVCECLFFLLLLLSLVFLNLFSVYTQSRVCLVSLLI